MSTLGEVSEKSIQIKVPRDRIGVLIGFKGAVKKKIEKEGGVKIEVDSEEGNVKITLKEGDPSILLKVRDVVTAIGRGFAPDKAMKLFGDSVFLDVIDLRDYAGKSESDLRRIKGRIIGKDGRTRRAIEESTGAYVSVYGHTLSVIGEMESFRIARQALQMLLEGSRHGRVYNFLFRKKAAVKRAEMEARATIWEEVI